MITGIVMSEKVHLPKLAGRIPDPVKETSTEKRLQRWMCNRKITYETYFLPHLQPLLSAVAQRPLVLVIDGSAVGRNCVALMICLVYRQRALPIAWTVAEGKKGHFPEEMHVQLVKEVQKLIPENAEVVLLGDGEFDGVNLQAVINEWRWGYVVRTSKSSVLTWEGHEFSFSDVANHVEEGDRFDIPNALFTHRQYGPIQAATWWRKGCEEPIHLVTNLPSIDEACSYYTKRFKIETFFSDQKSRGFHLHKSHISVPDRLSRLIIAACLAYHWIVYLGVTAIRKRLNRIVHRTERCDLSLFQLGLRLFGHLIKHGFRIPVGFRLVQ
jgi:hypothetical protein